MTTRIRLALSVSLPVLAFVACTADSEPGTSSANASPSPDEVAVGDGGVPDASSSSSAPAAGGCTPSTLTTYSKQTDIAYATKDPAQKLDLYVPDGTGPFPLVIWVHGGGWQSGDKALTQAMREAGRGYAVASINYRLSGTAKFPAQIHDVKAAVRWLRANAAANKIDPTRVAAFGSSAGGHLVALLGTSGGVASLEDLSLGNPTQPSNVQAVVDFFGPTDFSQMSATQLAICPPSEHDTPDSAPSKLVGCALPTCPEAVQKANPIVYVDAKDPPFLIAHGTADCTVPPNQSELLYDALRNAKVPAKLELIDGAEHGGPEFRSPKTNAMVDQFLDARLKNCL